MAPRTDLSLIDALLRKSGKWAKRFSAFEDRTAVKLGGMFSDYERQRRFLLLTFIGQLEVDPETGVLLDNTENLAGIQGMLDELGEIYNETSGRGSEFARYIDQQFQHAEKLGFDRATGGLRTARALPQGYRPPQPRLYRRVKTSLFKGMRNGFEADRESLARIFKEHVLLPNGTMEGLRTELLSNNMIEKGMVDSAGRRITGSERADRIAKFGNAQIAQEAQEDAIAEIYHDGEPNPDEDFWMWDAIRDNRTGDDSKRRDHDIRTRKDWDTHDYGDGMFGLPPIRPRDRCAAIFLDEEWFSENFQEKHFKGQRKVPDSTPQKK